MLSVRSDQRPREQNRKGCSLSHETSKSCFARGWWSSAQAGKGKNMFSKWQMRVRPDATQARFLHSGREDRGGREGAGTEQIERLRQHGILVIEVGSGHRGLIGAVAAAREKAVAEWFCPIPRRQLSQRSCEAADLPAKLRGTSYRNGLDYENICRNDIDCESRCGHVCEFEEDGVRLCHMPYKSWNGREQDR